MQPRRHEVTKKNKLDLSSSCLRVFVANKEERPPWWRVLCGLQAPTISRSPGALVDVHPRIGFGDERHEVVGSGRNLDPSDAEADAGRQLHCFGRRVEVRLQ